ncbi:MAG: beta-ketoacyl-ACP synthase II [Inconstantimicrobium porci]|uniref:beta-ketoacyl-ACP synthase II n=1 Tax=Inconstantimicrobium porci TaxID=2652291 RepID=UPI002408F4A7|nr:beta-ketoacyl-ACP synthase II [Inconstantimicrobium porci]MDD6770532.1 beta-ketoacyl-ACP synthase II [Inconstantimicrobium porci]MDY5913367.1 beta-ketoacyl-ACP synthase II [Inconstantimicrobium porci]
MENRVVITGLGVVAPTGNDVKTFWNSVKEGKCGIDYIKAFDTSDCKVKVAAEVKDFDAKAKLGVKSAKRMDRFCQMAMVAADEAVVDSGLDLEAVDKERMGVIVGSGIGGFATIEREFNNLFTKGTRMVSPFFVPMAIINMASGNISIKYGAKGLTNSCVTACASGSNAIGEAFRNIKHGYADIMIAGGAEAPITKLALSGFTNLKTLNSTNNIERSSIPFDKERAGFVMGEGAGILILESLEHAKKRNAKIYAEISGYGTTSDAYHITCPDPDGEGAAKAMALALKEGKVEADEVSYINAHGTSTEFNDKFETIAIKKVFGENAYNIPVSSTKAMTGHLLGAAGAIEAVISAKAISDSYIPATINYKVKDEDCDLDYVPNEGRNKELKYVLSNSFGFGGHNAVLLFKKWEE